jgi:hypothetical protein
MIFWEALGYPEVPFSPNHSWRVDDLHTIEIIIDLFLSLKRLNFFVNNYVHKWRKIAFSPVLRVVT